MGSKAVNIILLGLTPQGLALLRAFAKTGFRVLAVGRKEDVGIRSRYGTIICLNRMDHLQDLLAPYLSDQVKIHIASDLFLNHVVDHCGSLFERYEIFPNLKPAMIFRDKTRTAALARTLNIPTPESISLNRIDLQTYDSFPAIIKWNQTKKPTAFKTLIVHCPRDLRAFLESIESTENLIIQQLIPGGSDVDISYAGYFSKGIEKLGIGISQKRQYPQGLSSFVEAYDGKFKERLKGLALSLMSETGFSGFAEVECRMDYKNNRLYLIEVNPRACGWINILMKDFQRMLQGKKIETVSEKPAAWVNLVRDVRAVVSHIRSHGFQVQYLRQIIKDYMAFPGTDIFCLHDPKPFFFQFKKMFTRRIKF